MDVSHWLYLLPLLHQFYHILRNSLNLRSLIRNVPELHVWDTVKVDPTEGGRTQNPERALP